MVVEWGWKISSMVVEWGFNPKIAFNGDMIFQYFSWNT